MKKIRSFWTRLCAWAIGALGMGAAVTSCDVLDDVIGGGNLCMYGTPNMNYQISGKVVDEKTGEAIKGIQIGRPWKYGDNPVTTDDYGRFIIGGNEFPKDTIHVIAADIDGPANGSYVEREVVVDLKQTEKSNDAWYHGKYEAQDVKIMLEKVSE